MSDLPNEHPMRLGSVLKQVVRKRRINEVSAQQALNDLWVRIVGSRIATSSFVRKLRAGVLEIGVTNGTILEELTCYLHHDLLEQIRKEHPTPEIKSLKFVKVN